MPPFLELENPSARILVGYRTFGHFLYKTVSISVFSMSSGLARTAVEKNPIADASEVSSEIAAK